MTICFRRHNRRPSPPQARNCGYVFQNYALFPHMTLRENLVFAPSAARASTPSPRQRDARDIPADRSRRPPAPRSLRRPAPTLFHRASLIVAPKLLLLDEPAQGLDAPLRAEFYEVLRQVRADFKTPVLLVTHDLDECFELGEEMLILREGKIVQSGSPRKILDQPANIEVARLLGAFNLIPCEIRALDPGRNTSKVQMGEFELDGPYFPGVSKRSSHPMCPPGAVGGVRAPRPSRP